MITSVVIDGFASYQGEPVTIDGLKQRNYLFGTNGSGKSSIARVIDGHPSVPESCVVHWDAEPMRTMVYNKDFIERNFGSQLKGVFTLGEDDIATVERIRVAQQQVEDCESALMNQRQAFDAKSSELDALKDKFTEDCWVVARTYDSVFADALTGTRKNKAKFQERILAEAGSSAALRTVDELERDAQTLFGDEPVTEGRISPLDLRALLAAEDDAILSTKIVGTEDVDVAALIRKLESDDWVSEGRDYLGQTDGVCPFCQQRLPEGLEQSLNDYFDATYLSQRNELGRLVQDYEVAAAEVLRVASETLASGNRYLDSVEYGKSITVLKAELEANRRILAEKSREPSRAAVLRPLAGTAENLMSQVSAANEETDKHNGMVEDYRANKARLVSEVWKCLADSELKSEVSQYKAESKRLQATMSSIRVRIDETEDKRQGLLGEIAELSKKNTSIVPTKDYINTLLRNLGFSGFSLDVTSSNDGQEQGYVLVRPDNTLVEDTLSEGERSFIAFLYFISLLKGSHDSSALKQDTVVVIDDPVSSLDSEVLFIVSTLIRRLCAEAGEGTHHVKQVISLTHNTYFHKEVTFRSETVKGEQAFWLVRKPGLTSVVEPYEKNPVQTSYKFMWEELQRNAENARVIQNTMRRILEHYFKTMGGMKLDDLLEEFNEADQVVCHSLLAWVNDGSHSAEEDIFVCVDGCADTYLRVFRQIFEKSRHIEHYLMMCSPEMAAQYAAERQAEDEEAVGEEVV